MKYSKLLAICLLFSFLVNLSLSDVDFDDDDDDDLNEPFDPNPDFDTDVIAGSHTEAEKLKALDPEQVKRKLKILIQRMDLNKDGKVDKNELQLWIVNSLKNIDLEHGRSELALNDVNGDGAISFEEYLQKTYGYKENELEKVRKENDEDTKQFLRGIDSDYAKFKMADINKDGLLSLHEFTAFLRPGNYPHMLQHEINQHIEHFDKNGDARVSFAEFTGDNAHASDIETEKRHFDTFDKNKDGYLDKEELGGWAPPGMDKNAEEETKHLLESLDNDKDGFLSEREILADHDQFVNSEATDYGEQLRKMKDEL